MGWPEVIMNKPAVLILSIACLLLLAVLTPGGLGAGVDQAVNALGYELRVNLSVELVRSEDVLSPPDSVEVSP